MLRFPIFILLFVLSLPFACSTPSWFPIKKGPPHEAKKKELLHQEVIIIDRKEYVKVLNPRASEGRDQPKYLYIPVDEYLSKRETFAAPASRNEEAGKGFPVPTQPLPPLAEGETFLVSSSAATRADLKKKVLMAHFDDRTTEPDEVFGDWVAERLTRQVSQLSSLILFVDYPMVKEFLEKRGITSNDLEAPETLRLLNEVLGIQALVIGQLSGPYVFTTKPVEGKDVTASAIIKIEMKIVDTFKGKTFKNLSVSNPILASKEKGVFSREKAKTKAIDLAINDISRELSKELDGLDWFCRVAKVDGEEIYINAGRLTGLRVGDVMEVLRPGIPGEKEETKGKIRISAFLGIDASMARLVDGKKPDVNDILKPAKGKGT
jgi:hypothetical protein